MNRSQTPGACLARPGVRDKMIPHSAEPRLESFYPPFVAGIDLPHQGAVDSYNLHCVNNGDTAVLYGAIGNWYFGTHCYRKEHYGYCNTDGDLMQRQGIHCIIMYVRYAIENDNWIAWLCHLMFPITLAITQSKLVLPTMNLLYR